MFLEERKRDENSIKADRMTNFSVITNNFGKFCISVKIPKKDFNFFKFFPFFRLLQLQMKHQCIIG